VHIKKLRRAEGGAKIFGVFRVKNHDFTPKKRPCESTSTIKIHSDSDIVHNNSTHIKVMELSGSIKTPGNTAKPEVKSTRKTKNNGQ